MAQRVTYPSKKSWVYGAVGVAAWPIRAAPTRYGKGMDGKRALRDPSTGRLS
jgi:hypothetical protein